MTFLLYNYTFNKTDGIMEINNKATYNKMDVSKILDCYIMYRMLLYSQLALQW